MCTFRTTTSTSIGCCLGFLVGILTVGCNRVERTVESISGQTMGTTFSIKYLPAAKTPEIADIGQSVDAELSSVNNQMSTYIADSEVSRFNRHNDDSWFAVSTETSSVVQLALEYHRLSQGAFDITVGPLVNLWGFGPGKEPESIPSDEQIDELLKNIGAEKVEVRLDPPALRKLNPKVQIDLSAIAKGHGVDRVAKVLEDLDIVNYFIEIGGEIRTRGVRQDGRPWQIGIERPDVNQRQLHQVIGMREGAIATSGSYRNFWQFEQQSYSHFIDPKTGRPVSSELVSASVVMPDCASADAIATVLMVSGTLEKARQLTERHRWATLLIARRGDKLETIASPEFERQVQPKTELSNSP